MDPYLEEEKLWPVFQHQLITSLYQILLPGLVDRYRARVGQRHYVTEQPLFTSHAVRLTEWLMAAEGKNLVWRLNPYDELCFEAGRRRGVECRNDETYALALGSDPGAAADYRMGHVVAELTTMITAYFAARER